MEPKQACRNPSWAVISFHNFTSSLNPSHPEEMQLQPMIRAVQWISESTIFIIFIFMLCLYIHGDSWIFYEYIRIHGWLNSPTDDNDFCIYEEVRGFDYGGMIKLCEIVLGERNIGHLEARKWTDTLGSWATICWVRGSRTMLEDGVRMPKGTRFGLGLDMLTMVRWKSETGMQIAKNY